MAIGHSIILHMAADRLQAVVAPDLWAFSNSAQTGCTASSPCQEHAAEAKDETQRKCSNLQMKQWQMHHEVDMMVRDPCHFKPRNPSHNPTLENNTRSPRVDLSLSLSLSEVAIEAFAEVPITRLAADLSMYCPSKEKVLINRQPMHCIL